MSWVYRCDHKDCKYFILVGDRGMRGSDMGAGVEAANLMKEHKKQFHSEDK